MGNSKCGQCENDTFGIKKLEHGLFALVQCKECGNVVGALEDIDFNERFKTIINNQIGLDRLLNMKIDEVKSKQDEYDEKLMHIIESVDYIVSKIRT